LQIVELCLALRLAAMICPACKQCLPRSTSRVPNWSKVQWEKECPVVFDGNGWPRNCCRLCSDQVGEYFTDKVQVRPKAPYTVEELTAMYDASVKLLKKNVPFKFWDSFNKRYAECNIERRTDIVRRNVRAGLSEKTTLLKLMSYHGAVNISGKRAAFQIPASWADDKSQYLDPSNYFYDRVFRTCWPESDVSKYYNAEHVGDHVEAFFGYHWLACQRGFIVDKFIAGFVETLERALLAAVALYHFYRITA